MQITEILFHIWSGLVRKISKACVCWFASRALGLSICSCEGLVNVLIWPLGDSIASFMHAPEQNSRRRENNASHSNSRPVGGGNAQTCSLPLINKMLPNEEEERTENNSKKEENIRKQNSQIVDNSAL